MEIESRKRSWEFCDL